MDQLADNAALQQGLEKLNAKDRQELQQFVVNESQRAQIQGVIHDLTSVCFRKCITSKISSSALDRYEEPCMRNCVDRYMDAQNSVLANLQRVQEGRH